MCLLITTFPHVVIKLYDAANLLETLILYLPHREAVKLVDAFSGR